MALFAKATEFGGSEPCAKDKSMLTLSLVEMLFAVEKQLGLYRKRIEELFQSHPDHDLFGSLPGAGPSWLHACWPRSAMIGNASMVTPKTSSAWPALHQ